MAIQGLRDTDDVTQFKERPENWRQGILLLQPNGRAPLYALSSLMRSSSVDDPTYHWFEEELPDYRLALDEEITAAETELTVTSGATALREGDILYAEETGEQMMVTADPSNDTTINVSRGFAGSSASGIDHDAAGINPNLMLMAEAFEEGSSRPEGRTFTPDEKSNHCQIFRDTLEITNTARRTRYRTGDAVREDKRRTLDRHSIAIERAFFLSRKSTTVKNGRPRRTMDGIVPQIPASRDFSPSSNNDLQMSELEQWLKTVFTFGSNEKMAFAGNNFMLGLQQAVRLNSSYNIETGIKEAGMNVSRFMTPFGTLVVKTHPLFNQISGGSTGGSAYTAMDSWGVILDMDNLKYRFLEGRDTKYETDLQEDGVDGLAAGYISEVSIQVMHPKTHAVIKGVTGGIQDQ